MFIIKIKISNSFLSKPFYTKSSFSFNLKEAEMIKKIYNYIGIGFWSGAGVYSLINMILNLKHINQNNILNYNYLITGVAVFGLILNIILIKRKKGYHI